MTLQKMAAFLNMIAPGFDAMSYGTPMRRREGADATFNGWVVGYAAKLDGRVRYVCENADGILHIFSDKQIEARK